MQANTDANLVRKMQQTKRDLIKEQYTVASAVND
jgi:hypothetical protein